MIRSLQIFGRFYSFVETWTCILDDDVFIEICSITQWLFFSSEVSHITTLQVLLAYFKAFLGCHKYWSILWASNRWNPAEVEIENDIYIYVFLHERMALFHFMCVIVLTLPFFGWVQHFHRCSMIMMFYESTLVPFDPAASNRAPMLTLFNGVRSNLTFLSPRNPCVHFSLVASGFPWKRPPTTTCWSVPKKNRSWGVYDDVGCSGYDRPGRFPCQRMRW